MVDVIPLTTVHTVSLPLPALGPDAVRFFAVIMSAATRGGDRRAAGIATAIENLALAEERPTRSNGSPKREHAAHGWLAEYVRQLQEHLRRERAEELAGMSICLGVAYPKGNRIALSLAPAGGPAVLAIAHHTQRAPTALTVVEPSSDAPTLRFSHVVDGTIGPHDVLVIGTAALAAEPLRSTLAQSFARRTPVEAITELRRTLHRNDRSVQGAVVVHAHGAPIRSQTSMNSFLATAASTERFLTPKLGPILREYATQVGTAATSFSRTPRRRQRGHFLALAVDGVRLIFRAITVGLRSIASLIIDAARIIGMAMVSLVRFIRRTHASRTERRVPLSDFLRPATWRAHATRTFVRWRGWYGALPPTSQRLFLLMVMFALLFTISTTALWRRRATDAGVSSYNATIATIEELRSVAEARMLFNDREAARVALVEASAQLAQLPRTSRQRRERAELIDTELRASLDRARLLTRLQRPLLVARAGEKIPFPAIGGLVTLGSQIVAVSDDGRTLATINPRTGDAARADVHPATNVVAPFFTLALDDRSILIVDDHARAAIINTRDGVAQAAAIEQPPATVRGAALYQSRLYLLREDGSISRHARTAGGFGRGTTWLATDRAVADARALIVAGPVIVSADDGTIATYTAGRRKDLNVIQSVDPPLSGRAFLSVTSDGETLYLGDPNDGRIIAVHMDDGTLIGQIQSDPFRNMHAIALDPSGQSLYILHGNDISVIIPPKSS